MKFNKNNLAIISLLICAVSLMATMLSVFFTQSDISYETNKELLMVATLLLCITFCVYSLAVFKRVKPIKNIYISYSFEDEETADKIIFQLNDQLTHLSKYRFNIISKKDVPYGEDLYKAITTNINKSDIFLLVISSSYLQKESCIKEFQDIFQKKLNSEVKIIPIILDSFDNLSELPKNLSNIKSLSLIDCCSEEDFSQRITSLANDLIKQRKD